MPPKPGPMATREAYRYVLATAREGEWGTVALGVGSGSVGKEGPATVLSRRRPNTYDCNTHLPHIAESAPSLPLSFPSFLFRRAIVLLRAPVTHQWPSMVLICARQSSAIPRRFAQAGARRGFSTRSYMCQEVRDAYILSASRTPTAKVCLPHS